MSATLSKYTSYPTRTTATLLTFIRFHYLFPRLTDFKNIILDDLNNPWMSVESKVSTKQHLVSTKLFLSHVYFIFLLKF